MLQEELVDDCDAFFVALGIPADERDNQKLFAALSFDECYNEDDLWSARIRTFDHLIT